MRLDRPTLSFKRFLDGYSGGVRGGGGAAVAAVPATNVRGQPRPHLYSLRRPRLLQVRKEGTQGRGRGPGREGRSEGGGELGSGERASDGGSERASERARGFAYRQVLGNLELPEK